MPVNNSKKTIARSSKVRSAALPKANRSRKNGSGEGRADAGTSAGLGLHLLGQQLKSKTTMEVSLLTGDHNSDSILSMIDTEAKQLQVIEDLLAIVKAQPKYKNLREPSWNEETSPLEILNWLLRKLGPLAKGEDWLIDTYRDGRKNRHRFVVIQEFLSHYVHRYEVYFPVDFLPFLKKRDAELHDLYVDILALVSKYNSIPLWDEDGDFSKQLEILQRSSKTNNELLNDQIFNYVEGAAFQYLTLIKRRKRSVRFEDIERRLYAYKPTSLRKRYVIHWMFKGLRMAESKKNILINTFVPNSAVGNPVTPFRLYKIVWSVHKSDVLKARANAQITKDEKAFGEFWPVNYSVCIPGKIVKPFIPDGFAVKLFDFMHQGEKIVTQYFQDFFYKDRLKDPNGRKTLIEIFELMEIQNPENEQ